MECRGGNEVRKCLPKERVELVSKERRTGTLIIVSAMKSFFSQCSTEEPTKWPPHCTTVTPGRISLAPLYSCLTPLTSSLLSHSASSVARYTGQLNCAAHSRCVV